MYVGQFCSDNVFTYRVFPLIVISHPIDRLHSSRIIIPKWSNRLCERKHWWVRVRLWCCWPLNFHHYDCIGDFNGGVGLIFDRGLTSAAMVFLPQLSYLLEPLYENAKHRGIGCKCTILPNLFSFSLQPKTTTKLRLSNVINQIKLQCEWYKELSTLQ